MRVTARMRSGRRSRFPSGRAVKHWRRRWPARRQLTPMRSSSCTRRPAPSTKSSHNPQVTLALHHVLAIFHWALHMQLASSGRRVDVAQAPFQDQMLALLPLQDWSSSICCGTVCISQCVDDELGEVSGANTHAVPFQAQPRRI